MTLRKNLQEIIVIVLIAVCIMPFLVLPFFSLPMLDDFYNASHQRRLYEQNPSPFYGAVTVLVDGYLHLGYPPIVFVNFLFAPFLRFGIAGIRATVFCMNLMFLLSTYLFVKWVLKGICKDTNRLHRLIFYLLLIACFGAFRYNEEIFTWATCSLGYLLPINCMFLGLAFFVKAYVTSKRRYWIFTAVLGVAGACGPTNISALVCGLYVAAFLLLLINRKNSGAAAVAVFVVIAAGILALCAPGLYTRHVAESLTTEYSWLSSLSTASGKILEMAKGLLLSPVSLVICFAAIFASKWFTFAKPVHWLNIALTAAVAVVAPTIVVFPHFLGYGTDFFPLRAAFVADVIIMISIFGVLLSVIALCKSRMGKRGRPQGSGAFWPLAVTVALLGCALAVTWPLGNFTPLRVMDDLLDGDLKRTNEYWIKTLNEWEHLQGRDVLVIEEDQQGYRVPYLVYPYARDVANDWSNAAIANFYGMNSIRSVPYEEFVQRNQ